VPELLKQLFGKVFADRCYVSAALAQQLLADFGIKFFAKPRRTMKNQLMHLSDKMLARERSIIVSMIDQLKNISQIEHSRLSASPTLRECSPVNCFVHLLCGLIAYCHQPKKPSLNLDFTLPKAA
jgi:hypothetical protein